MGAEELNRFLFNEDTVDKVLATLMEDGYKVTGGDRLGKAIIFAKSRAHAEFVQQRFDLGWPEYAGLFARVIVHGNTYAQSLIDDFSIPDKTPHIAISVDMLDTGIDVPEVVNLVLFKMVRSKTKFWQMLGRGTRLSPDLFGPGQRKTDFLVFDFCGNLEYFSQDLPGIEGAMQKSLSERIYEARLGLVLGLDQAKQDAELRRDAARELHTFVEGMTLDNVLVRPHRRAVEQFAQWESWSILSDADAEAALGLAGLPSAAKDADEDAKRFDLLILRRQLAQLEGHVVSAERLRASVQAIAAALLGKLAIPLGGGAGRTARIGGRRRVVGRCELADAGAGAVANPRPRSLRGQGQTQAPIHRFEDTLGEAVDVALPYATPGTDTVRFQAKAAAYMRQHLDHVALQRLRRNKQLTSDDVSSLERMLLEAGGRAADVERAGAEAGGLGLFIRGLVGLDRVAATEAFGHFLIDDHAPVGPDQVFGEGD